MLPLASLLIMFGTVRMDDPLRPQFHLMGPKNWMNDPDGPVYYNGYYHMFFIHNPNAPVWGHNHWVKHTKSFFLIICFF
jgi:sucrose-6-phosphate hydrolase SacC (GH32 family)